MTPAVEADQLGKLRSLFAAILGRNPFYSAKLGGIADLPSLEWFSAHVPFTIKHELVEDQRALPPFGSNLTYPLDRYTRFNQTNGTTGAPVRWLDTPESWNWMIGNWTRVFESAGVGAGDRIFFAFSFGPFLGFWVAFDAAVRMGCMAIPGGGMRSSARLRSIVDHEATVLCCTPTYAMRLGEAAAEEHIDLTRSKVRKIIVAGEPGGSIKATRARIEELWPGARVVDHHGMTEVGPVSYECPARGRVLHVIESSYIAEVIDPANGSAVTGGGKGELVLTNLGRTGSPLIRYRTGDVVQLGAGDVCACGSRDLALEGGILARTDDMVVVRGVNLYPSAIEEIVRGCDGIVEYRVEVHTDRALPELSIQVESAKEETVCRLELALRDTLGLRIPVSCVPIGSLPRFEMKAQRWARI